MVYVGYNGIYRSHNYIGHEYTSHNYINHDYINHGYISHDYISHNYIGGGTGRTTLSRARNRPMQAVQSHGRL